MGRSILVDTDVMVDYLRGYEQAVTFVRERVDEIALSSIVVAELYAGVKSELEQAILDELISLFRVFPITAEVAKVAGLLKRDFGKSHGVGLADAILAATAQTENVTLVTLNVRHYPMFGDLKPAYSKG
ncbi:MAG: type II toxin-antitoxin system VapC family toxin [Planctomycetes bacterium]|nr:type II toxin-antitoxin system VapC family toxin [Planctomycetota bacterium]